MTSRDKTAVVRLCSSFCLPLCSSLLLLLFLALLLGGSAAAEPSSVARGVICHIADVADSGHTGPDGAMVGAPRSRLWDDGLRDLVEYGDGAMVRGRGPENLVAFTFDDGPSHETTPAVLDALDRHDVPATFFVVGWRFAGTSRDVPRNLEVLHDVIARGYHIGNHTFRHENLALAEPRVMREEIDRTARALREILGYTPHAFRPPFGAMNKRARSHLADQGFTEIRWAIDTRDFLSRSSRALRKTTVESIIERRGGVVLMHDTKTVTANAIAGILDDLEAHNCRRLEGGESIIVPVSLHYFMRDRDGTPRAIPPDVQARTRAYREDLPGRCTARSEARERAARERAADTARKRVRKSAGQKKRRRDRRRDREERRQGR